MLLHALALVLASSAPSDSSTLSVKVVSLDFSYPYFGEPGNTCRQGSVYLRGVADSKPVVVRLVDSAGLTPGAEATLGDVRRAGTGKDGTPVYCASGRQSATPAPAPAPAVVAETQPPMVPAESAATPAPVETPAPATPVAAGESRCTARIFHIIKKAQGDKKFGPSEFDPSSGLDVIEPVDCSLARSRVTNVLLVKMVKEGFSKPASVVGAEWGPGSAWQKDTDVQRRVVKVYLAESPDEVASQR